MPNHHKNNWKLTLPVPWISGSCIEINVNLHFYFLTFLWCIKRFYEGLHKTFWGSTRLSYNLLRLEKDVWKSSSRIGMARVKVSSAWYMVSYRKRLGVVETWHQKRDFNLKFSRFNKNILLFSFFFPIVTNITFCDNFPKGVCKYVRVSFVICHMSEKHMTSEVLFLVEVITFVQS